MQNVAVLQRDTYDNVALLDRVLNQTELVGFEGADTGALAVTSTTVDSIALVASEGEDAGIAAGTSPNLVTGGGVIPTEVVDVGLLVASEGADTGTVAVASSTSITLLAATEGEDSASVLAEDFTEAAYRVQLAASEGADTAAATASGSIGVELDATEGADVGALAVHMVETDRVAAVATEGADTVVALLSTRELGASLITLSPPEVVEVQTSTASVTVRDQFGTVVPGYPVRVSSGNDLVALVLDPAATTNASGVAQVLVRTVGSGQVNIRAQVGSYTVSAELGVFDRLMTLGDSVAGTVRVRDINSRPRRGVRTVANYSKPGIVSVTGIDPTNIAGEDAYTITAIARGETELWFTAGSRVSNRMRIKVR